MSDLAKKANLTLQESVEYLRSKDVPASYRTLRRWIALGLLHVVKVRSKCRFVSRESLDRMARAEPME